MDGVAVRQSKKKKWRSVVHNYHHHSFLFFPSVRLLLHHRILLFAASAFLRCYNKVKVREQVLVLCRKRILRLRLDANIHRYKTTVLFYLCLDRRRKVGRNPLPPSGPPPLSQVAMSIRRLLQLAASITRRLYSSCVIKRKNMWMPLCGTYQGRRFLARGL